MRMALLNSILVVVVVLALWTTPARCGPASAMMTTRSRRAVVRVGRRADDWRVQRRQTTTTTTTTLPPHSCLSFLGNNTDSAAVVVAAVSAAPPVRAGASATAIKTMTARQMETLNLFSGGVAGTVASCLTNPLEVIKTRLQSSSVVAGDLASGRGHPLQIARNILETDGVPGFFRGLLPTLIGIVPSRSAYFYAYQRCKQWLDPVFPQGSPPNAMISGLLAGITGNTLTNPIWMVRTRMQLYVDAAAGQVAYRGYGDVIRTIFREEGVKGFYKGIQASYWGCTEGAVQFILYEQFKTRLLKRENARLRALGLPSTTELSPIMYFWSAAAAKMVASVATYPHEVARTRMREQARMGVFKYNGMWQTIALIGREEGRKGLYSGMGVHLMKVVPNSALMFLTYEVVRRWLSGYTIVDSSGGDELMTEGLND